MAAVMTDKNGLALAKATAGYRRPPVSSRWKHGQSGNTNGPKPKRVPKSAVDPEGYKVGYKRPPLHTRFKPGRSANPNGRRPRDILQEVLLSPFPVKIGAKTEMAPALDVMLLRIRARAIAGDQKVIRSLIEHFGAGALTGSLVNRSAK